MAITSHGISADAVAAFSGQPIPGNLYYELSQRAERITKAAEAILYNTVHLVETKNLYFADNKLTHFNGKIVDIFSNIKDNNKRNIVILD
jgi:alanyl-tRNA synthetase